MALYGAIPFMQAQKSGYSVGVFWLNAAETWVDIVKSQKNPNTLSTEKRSTHTHWMSENGLLDVFFLRVRPRVMYTNNTLVLLEQQPFRRRFLWDITNADGITFLRTMLRMLIGISTSSTSRMM
jgi:hypothetical protein